MNRHLLKKYKTLGQYHEMTTPHNFSPKESFMFYEKNKEVIDFESTMYSQISHDRKMLGGNKRIHKINKDGRNKV
jgi:hypothetical protein